MRAAQFDSYGAADVIRIATVPVPVPGAGHVLVRVRATSVNGGELLFRAGRLRLLSGRRFPKGLNIDFAGEIAALGPEVADARVGDRVWGALESARMLRLQSPIGSAADYLVVAADRTAPMPTRLDFGESVALLAGTAALPPLRDIARVRQGERVLVRGGTGGVGFVAVQLAHALGARVTTLVSAANIPTALDLGAEIALDYRVVGPADLGDFDVVFDTVGTDMAAYRRLLAPGGRMVTIALMPPLRALAAVAASVVHGSRRVRFFKGSPRRALLVDYADLVDRHGIRALIAATYPLEQLAAAHVALERGGVSGKHVILL